MTYINTENYGQGKTIVLIHGWAMHSGIWRTFAQQLVSQYKVICIDLPGHGLSETVEPYTLEQISQVLIESLAEENSFDLLGWSLGASVAMTMARNYPKKINSLILLAANPHFVKQTNWDGVTMEILQQFADNLSKNSRTALLRFLTIQVNNAVDNKSMIKELRNAINECPVPSQKVLTSGLKILTTADLRACLSSLLCPIKIILGEKDQLVPPSIGLAMQSIQPNCEIHVIDEAGHIPFISHQQQVLEIISRTI